jgi:hypothetical protein
MLKDVDYVIDPIAARPSRIQRWADGDIYEFDLDKVEQAALRETLQTTLGANPFSSFISGFIYPYSDYLQWLDNGPGVGREMRRAFSALFGRFFARAYLTDCHNFVWFTPLDGPVHNISNRLCVSSRAPRQDLPDWICASRTHLALAEAKGARSGTPQSQPAPIRQAIKQLRNCRVETYERGTKTWVHRTVKGWAVLNRWSFQSSNVPPFLFVVDPETEGDQIPINDLPALIRAVARGHVAGLFRGMRLFNVASLLPFEPGRYRETSLILPGLSMPHVSVAVAGLPGITAIGRLFRSSPGDSLRAGFENLNRALSGVSA